MNPAAEGFNLKLGELSEQLGYVLKRAQLKVFENFLRCMASLQLTPAQFSVLLLVEKNRAIEAYQRGLLSPAARDQILADIDARILELETRGAGEAAAAPDPAPERSPADFGGRLC